MKINMIYLTNLEDGSDIFCDTVGKNGVTNIEKIAYSPEPFCHKFYFNIYKGDLIAYERHQVTTVIYDETEKLVTT